MYVLDSLRDQSYANRELVDRVMWVRFEEVLHFFFELIGNSVSELEVVYEDLLRQHNSYDCGVYVLKYMELWDGVARQCPITHWLKLATFIKLMFVSGSFTLEIFTATMS
ncbi:Ulp1 protease family C-terminal catalytic domain containing protein [Spatholobus suberectus]|nr:Ulp1 protease family C-terminal catalytic domain containing protein [Spatholobus suberectus]